MATRKKIPPRTETRVLILSRRRCCICFGLNRDAAIVWKGQIAHLNRDASNSELENLVYLCLAHHDQYDSRSLQSKGMTPGEVKYFRSELYEWVKTGWKEKPPFPKPATEGETKVFLSAPISGHYVREGVNDNAELEVTELPGERVRVSGLALWGTLNDYGPRVGELDFEVPLASDGTACWSDKTESGTYVIQLLFETDVLIARESFSTEEPMKGEGYLAAGTTFDGVFKRVS